MKVPSKFYYLPGAGDDGIPDPPTTPQITNPNIAGFRWRQDHATVQTAISTYDWSAVDGALNILGANDKLMGLSIAWGDSVGRWLYDDEGVEEFIFDPANEVGSMPNPFDPLYLPILFDFITTMGGIYNTHPDVSYVVVSGIMQHFEGYLAKTADEETRLNTAAVDAGYTDLAEGWLDVAQQIISAFVTAFPDTAVLYTSAKPFPSDSGQTNQNILKDWITETYPMHAGWMTAQLHAATGPWPPPTAVNWPHGFQAIHSAQNIADIYSDPPDPLPAYPQPMIDYINNGFSKGAQFLEIYPFDMNLAINQQVFADLAPMFHSFVDYIPPGGGDGSLPPPISVPTQSIPVTSVSVPNIVTARSVVPRIIQCRTGTHARNIILARKRLGPPVVVPSAPGPVEILDVVTPHTPSSGQATATFLSPVGSDAANLSYILFLTGGSGTIQIVSQEPV